MFSVTDILCGRSAGQARLRYGHVKRAAGHPEDDGPQDRAPRPVVVWALTQACNLRCVHCYASAGSHAAPGELTFNEGRALLDDLRHFGVPAVLFSGGEPLVRPDALDLIAYARSLGLSCTLSTNGLLLDAPVAERLAACGLRYAGISLDGAPARHDRLRGQAGAFEAVLKAVACCQARGIQVGLRFTVHALNAEDLDFIFDLCRERSIDRLCIYHLAYAGRGQGMRRTDLSLPQTRALVEQIFERTRQLHADGVPLEVLTVGNHADAAFALLDLERREPALAGAAWSRLEGSGGNRSGCQIASIDPVGNVHYDQFSWHYPCGQIRNEPFSQIWSQPRDPRLALLRDRSPHLPKRCQSCRFLRVCNGNLRTRAEAATGDWLGFDPACYLTQAETSDSIS